MQLNCKCDMRTKLVGDGCQKCNTNLVIESMYTPEELAEELKSEAGFSDDQAYYIAADGYQPLIGLIGTLNEKINELANAIK